MGFRTGVEDRNVRSLIMLTQENTRLTVEVFRKTLHIFDAVINNKKEDVEKSLSEFKEIIIKADQVKLTSLKEIQKIGGLLVNRDDFIRLISILNDIIDHLEAIAFRFSKIRDTNWKVPKNIAIGLSKMADLSFKAINEFRDAIMSLGFDSQKATNFTQQVYDTEKTLDMLYVDVDYDIITCSENLSMVLILRDVASLFESLVDYLQNASDLILIIGM
jgi:uncharacterized protein Yka (UPF0111/DUF47 family)